MHSFEERIYNLEVLKITTDGDDEFLLKILNTFLNNNKELLGKIQEALKTNKLQDIGNFSHKMLSSYKHLEVNLLIDPLTKLESLSLGYSLDPKEIKLLVDYLSYYSVRLFAQIEQEIELVGKQ